MATRSGVQEQEQQSYNRDEEYLSAQRAAHESLEIGRATLAQAQQQHEQLERASAIADDTNYTLDKAGRVLRGMTWSGWVANKFSRDVAAPTAETLQKSQKARAPPEVYENVPPVCATAAQAVQNYHANVKVLLSNSCETAEQRETMHIVCDTMHQQAQAAVQNLPTAVQAYRLELATDLNTLRARQRPGEGASTTATTAAPSLLSAVFVAPTAPARGNSTTAEARTALLGQSQAAGTTKTTQGSSPDDRIRLQQDEHLQTISQSLGELGNLAQNLQHSLHYQNETVNKLDTQSETILEKSQMVTRRADRLIQKKSWTPVKATLDRVVSIRHLATGQYLSITTNGTVCLVPIFHPETCVFSLWKRQGKIFGLKNKYNDRWLGQNLLGSLACSSWQFGRREEWEDVADTNNDDDEQWNSTRLLCASAGWGAGGYLHVRTTTSSKDSHHTVVIGGLGIEERKKADLWSIAEAI